MATGSRSTGRWRPTPGRRGGAAPAAASLAAPLGDALLRLGHLVVDLVVVQVDELALGIDAPHAALREDAHRVLRGGAILLLDFGVLVGHRLLLAGLAGFLLPLAGRCVLLGGGGG